MASPDELKQAGVESPLTARLTSGVVWIGLAVLGCLAFFWDGLSSLVTAWSLPEYSHGPLIPVIASYLCLRELRRQPPQLRSGSQMPGLLVIVLGLLIGLVGNLTQIPYFITYGLLVVIGGLILLIAGVRRGVRFWVPWIYLFFMLPLPTSMYWQLSTKLQFISSHLGVEVIQFMAIPVYLDGNIIDLGNYKLQVAEACSGLRYLFPLVSFGFLFAVLYRGPVWHKVCLFLSSLPITVLMNSFRIGVIAILVNSFGIAQAEGFLHLFEGWIIFVVCILLLYLEAFLLQRLVSKPQSLLNLLDLDFTGFGKPLYAMASLPGSKKLTTAALILLLSGVLWQLYPARTAPKIVRDSFATFPMTIAEWKGIPGPKLDPIIERVLGADDYLTADYSGSAEKAPVNLLIAYYNSTTDGTGIHSPQVCIPGGGWEVSTWQQVPVSSGDPAAPTFVVNRAVIQKGTRKQLVYYWFEMRGRRLANEYQAKFYTIWDSLLTSRADGALMRFVTSIEPGESEAAADRRLETFLTSVIKVVSPYVPK